MNTGFIEAFSQIIREKRVDKSTLIETIKTSLISAAKRKLGPEAEIEVKLDESNGALEIYRVYKVVEDVTDEQTELTVDKAKKIDDTAEIGAAVRQQLPIEEFGRNAIQTAKQVLMQKVREAERERIYEDYKDKVGVIVSGTVRQVDRGNILVNLGRAEAYLPIREQIRKERYNQGDTIRACIIEVDRDAKGPQIILSRTSDQFLRKLFDQEVPEIFDGDVEIKSIAREPGGRSKIAVFSRSDKVDAVGSCVGMKGSRVQAVVNELHGEKIDIVNWSETSSEFVSRALAPAKVSSLRFNESEKEAVAIVDDDQLSLAIGKEGQNVRLASRLTGWKIDLMSVKETELRDRLEQKLQMDISEMYGVTARLAQKLKNTGILTVQKLHKTPVGELLDIEGIGEKTAEKLKGTAAETMEELKKALEELVEKEKAEAAAAEKPLFDEKLFGAEPKVKKEEVPLTEEELFKNLESKETEEMHPEDESEFIDDADTEAAQQQFDDELQLPEESGAGGAGVSGAPAGGRIDETRGAGVDEDDVTVDTHATDEQPPAESDQTAQQDVAVQAHPDDPVPPVAGTPRGALAPGAGEVSDELITAADKGSLTDVAGKKAREGPEDTAPGERAEDTQQKQE